MYRPAVKQAVGGAYWKVEIPRFFFFAVSCITPVNGGFWQLPVVEKKQTPWLKKKTPASNKQN